MNPTSGCMTMLNGKVEDPPAAYPETGLILKGPNPRRLDGNSASNFQGSPSQASPLPCPNSNLKPPFPQSKCLASERAPCKCNQTMLWGSAALFWALLKDCSPKTSQNWLRYQCVKPQLRPEILNSTCTSTVIKPVFWLQAVLFF